MTNMTDMDFSRDEHDLYRKISSVLLCSHAHMFVLEVKLQYTIILGIDFSAPGLFGIHINITLLLLKPL